MYLPLFSPLHPNWTQYVIFMPSLRKYHVNKSVLFVTYSIEEGLLLLANPLIDLIIKSSLAHAQSHHPVRICHFLVEATHIHFIMIVDNPDDIDGFAERFKTESAHRLNRILGRKKRTVWCKGYDSPTLLTEQDVIEKIIYIYTNPAKDNLEDSIESYPGLSSWRMFPRNEWAYIPRSDFESLPRNCHSLSGYTREAERLLVDASRTLPFKLHSDEWMDTFGIFDVEERKRVNDKIDEAIKVREEDLRLARTKSKSKVLGRHKLITQVLNLIHRPVRAGKKMWCICHDKKQRKAYIDALKKLSKIATEVFHRWKVADYSVPFPPGLYPPCMPKLALPLAAY